jgi:hypothetical protein
LMSLARVTELEPAKSLIRQLTNSPTHEFTNSRIHQLASFYL